MTIIETLGNACKAIAAIFGYAKQRDGERNTPTMQANASAKTEEAISSQVKAAEQAASTGDLSKVRELASE